MHDLAVTDVDAMMGIARPRRDNMSAEGRHGVCGDEPFLRRHLALCIVSSKDVFPDHDSPLNCHPLQCIRIGPWTVAAIQRGGSCGTMSRTPAGRFR